MVCELLKRNMFSNYENIVYCTLKKHVGITKLKYWLTMVDLFLKEISSSQPMVVDLC